MKENKFQRTIDIILQNQAQFYADLQQMQEGNKELREIQKEAEKRTNVLERACINLYNTSVEQGKNITKSAEETAELREAIKETDERLNAVIFMAEKYFSGNGKSNGKSKK